MYQTYRNRGYTNISQECSSLQGLLMVVDFIMQLSVLTCDWDKRDLQDSDSD
jgi:hypothetical protein